MNESFRGAATQNHTTRSGGRAHATRAGVIAALCVVALSGCAQKATPAGGHAASGAKAQSSVTVLKSTQAPQAKGNSQAAGKAVAGPQAKGQPSTTSDSSGSRPAVPTQAAADPKVGFASKEHGAPAVKRKGERPANARVKAAESGFTSTVDYGDGVTISTTDFNRGTVTSRGAGVPTGAPFVVFSVTLQNGSAAPLDLSAVVMTLRYGADEAAAAPLYTDVPARDFSGTVAPGAKASAVYAFQLPHNVTDAALYVDIDGSHAPATFTGSIPK